MKTIMDVQVGDAWDKEAELFCHQIRKTSPALYNKARELLRVLALDGLWKGFYVALAEIIRALTTTEISTPIYARDLKSENLTDTFFGIGFEDLLKKANEEDRELIVGNFLKTPVIE